MEMRFKQICHQSRINQYNFINFNDSMFNPEGKGFSYHHITTPNHQFTLPFEIKTPSSKKQLQSQPTHAPLPQILGVIDCTSNRIKQKTIELVKVLRQHNIPSSLEKYIETYLTDVLDQMDILQTINPDKVNKLQPNQQGQVGLSFQQIQKPRGDQEQVNFEQTLRDITFKTNKNTEKDPSTLQDKIENILRSIEPPPIEEEDSKDELMSQREVSQNSHTSIDSRFKKAHKFSNNYMRDVLKPKRNKVL